MIHVEFVATQDLSERQREAFTLLRATVYPPEVVATLPGRLVSWAAPEWSVLVWVDDQLVSRVGLVCREGRLDGAPQTLGGIGGVMTLPSRQGQGWGTIGLREAARILKARCEASFSLLFCSPSLSGFYGRLGWVPFAGRVVVDQPEGRVDFSSHGPLVRAGASPAPTGGEIDLCGLPW